MLKEPGLVLFAHCNDCNSEQQLKWQHWPVAGLHFRVNLGSSLQLRASMTWHSTRSVQFFLNLSLRGLGLYLTISSIYIGQVVVNTCRQSYWVVKGPHSNTFKTHVYNKYECHGDFCVTWLIFWPCRVPKCKFYLQIKISCPSLSLNNMRN